MKAVVSPHMCHNLLAGAALAVACLLMAGSALANTVTVTTLADPHEDGKTSLREAIPDTGINGTINFQAGLTGTITLTSGELYIGRSLTITGPGATILTISGNGKSRVFNILSNTPALTVTISGLSIQSGTVTGTNGIAGGHVFNIPAQGGGILNSGTLTLSDCTVAGNQAFGAEDLPPQDGDVNGGAGLGGGIFSSGNLTLVNCSIQSNDAEGGVAYFGNLGGAGLGGGVYSEGTLAVTNCTFSGNSATGGLGEETALTGQAGGGGIYLSGAGGSFANCTIDGNSVTGGNRNGSEAGNGSGGGMFIGYNFANNPVMIVNCTISFNICAGADSASAVNSPGSGIGGGICLFDINVGTPVTLISCTISRNTCSGGASTVGGSGGNGYGGGIYAFQANTTLENTIVSGNNAAAGSGSPPGSGAGFDVAGSTTSGGFNLIGRTDSSLGWVSSDQVGGTIDATRLDPQLGPLQDNGGPTPTMALMAGSAAIDQGNCFNIHTDQRGLQRPFNYLSLPFPTGGDGSDNGAFELRLGGPVLSVRIYPPSLGGSPNLGIIVNPLVANTGPSNHFPIFGVQKLPNGLTASPGVWTFLHNPMRYINKQYLVKDTVSPGETTAFYRASGPTTDIVWIPPAYTLAASNITATSATLNGNTTPFGSNTLYWFEYGMGTNYGQTTLTNTLTTSTNPANLVLVSNSISGLSPAQLYHFQLVVVDDDGTQLGGDQTFTTTGAAGPPTVTTLAVSSGTLTATSAQLNGSVNPNGADTTYWFEYGLDTNYTGGTISPGVVSASNTNAVGVSSPVNGLTQGTRYHFQLLGTNSAGTSSGGDVTFTTPLLPVVVTYGIRDGDYSPYYFVLNGTVNPETLSAHIGFEYGTDTNYGTRVFVRFTQPNADVEFYTNTLYYAGLTTNITYHYRAIAFSQAGEGVGADAIFTTPP